tara:strand:- start:212 stop:814 length:603 start_codon:yes stop_codon:yes gene_type:complete
MKLRPKDLTIKQVLKKTNVVKSKAMKNLAYGAALKKVNKLKKELLTELNSHPVTKEIENGVSGMNSSLLGGHGNFFAFLGFRQSAKPVEIIRQGFESFINIQKTPKLRKSTGTMLEWDFPITYPSMAEIYGITPLPWTTQSWVKGVEKGIGNFTNTIFGRNEDSRSGFAIQGEKPRSNYINFSPTPYITPMLARFRSRLK